MKTKHFIVLIAITFMLSCGSRQHEQGISVTGQALEAHIPGNWEWVKTKCCLPEMRVSGPEDCSCSESLNLDEENHYRLYKDGEIIREGSFRIRYGTGDEPAGSDDKVFLELEQLPPALVSIKNDTLILDRSYMDLEIKYYVKE